MVDLNEPNIYVKHDIEVMDLFIDKFARKYIEQRNQTNADMFSLRAKLSVCLY